MADYGISGQTILAADRSAFVAYLPIGYPNVDISLAAMAAVVEAGAHIVEIGMPYTDPILDGPVIQRAGTRALQRGVRTKDLFRAASAVREAGGMPVSMTYWNIVDRYGVAAFARDFANAGGAGLITPDLTPDEGEDWIAASDVYGLDRIFLVSPSSTDERIASTTNACRGWVYATAVMGVTGTRTESSAAAPELVRRIRRINPEVLIGVGLGISNGDQARETCEYADAAIVGSALIKPMLAGEEAGRPDDLSGMITVATEVGLGVRS